MKLFVKIFWESTLQAFGQLRSNKLRSFLSLLGITIGIFCTIGVKSSVDSLENNIRTSFNKLGSDIVFISKFSWTEDPHNSFWKWMRRPDPDISDFQIVAKKVKSASLLSFHVLLGMRTIKYRSSNVNNAFLIGATQHFGSMFGLKFENGRFFSMTEFQRGTDKVVLGYKVANELFGAIDPIGKEVTLSGRKLIVVGVIERTGKDILKVMDFDECILTTYALAKKMANLKSKNIFATSLNVKAAPDTDMQDLKDELQATLRAHRQLKPKEEDDFSLNEMSILVNMLDQFFKVLNLAGFVIGLFAILVGMFSVANIMFVSVKERTKMIGIKKAIGAKRSIILAEFLIEAIILCLIGGLLGLLLTFAVVNALAYATDFKLFLSLSNILWGIVASIAIGILSGFIPAFQASKMNPVDAMRKN